MNANLPIWNCRKEIIDAVKENDTVIIAAETGSGKSTQIPQYLYNEGYSVIVTQPRRIACITLADRVSEEMGSESGVVAYKTAFESTRTPDTKILFCTDGLQMAKGIYDIDNTILVLDEVHEWNLNLETLIAWIKKFREDGNRIKVVLMSATIETTDLEGFYSVNSSVKCLSVYGKPYHVDMVYKDPSYNEFIVQIQKYTEAGNNVLAFVPGKKEISDTITVLEDLHVDAEILPLHGELYYEDQRKCFRTYNRPKVIISTNIAQTSVTIPDIDVVVDMGTERRLEVENGIEGLFVRDISKADCLQRAGRAGRTKDGTYVLVSSLSLEDRDDYSVPEIQRLNLDKVVLKLLSVGINAEELEFFHQPSKESLIEAKELLEKLGAIKDGKITNIGLRMIKLPVSPRFAKMILSAEGECVEDIINIVSILEVGSLIRYGAKKETYFGEVPIRYSDFTTETKSDILAELEIYYTILSGKIRFNEFRDRGLSKKNFQRIKELSEKLTSYLKSELNTDTYTTDRNKLISCIYEGFVDRVYYAVTCFDDCRDINGCYYSIERGSCVYSSRNYFLLGIPKTISFKDRFGSECTRDIITMVTGLTETEMINIAGPTQYKEIPDPSNIRFDLNTEDIFLPFHRELCGYRLDDETKTFSKGTSDYEYYEALYRKELEEFKKNAKIKIGDHEYPIIYKGTEYPRIYIDNDDDIFHSTEDYLEDSRGGVISIYYNGYEYYGLRHLRESLIERRRIDKQIKARIDAEATRREHAETAARKKEMKALIPDGETSSTKEIVTDFIPKLSTIEFNYPEFDMVGVKYVGLENHSGKAKYKLFETEDERNTETLETLKTILRNEVRTSYGDNNFVIKRAGTKFETPMAKAAKDEFHDWVNQILDDLTIENFSENIELLEEVFQDCVSKVM